MKKAVLFLLMFLSMAGLYAQTEAPELETSFSALKTFFLPALSGALLVLFADAKKWMFTGEWDWWTFISTKALPFAYGFGGAIVLYLLLAFLPFLRPFLEVLAGEELTQVSAAALVGMATSIIDGLLKPKKVVEDEKVEQ